LGERRKRRGRPGRVTCVDKANVFVSMAFFRKVFDEVAARHPDIEARHNYIDATALDLVRRPWDFDVLVTENMFGDILSDETAALVGGMGMAPSGDIGDEHGLFQPCHGSAPDIAGQGKANPTATILSAAMMLDWLAERSGVEALGEAAARIERAVDAVYASGRIAPFEFGGRDGTRAIAGAIASNL
jgi:3-isopropylmalate dehydrogenase